MKGSWRRARQYWETVRHLRPVQIYGRLWFRAFRPQPNKGAAPALRQEATGHWIRPALRRQTQIGSTRFRFLNETRELADCGWDDPEVPKLWRYNLHYFDDLSAENANLRIAWHEALVARWIEGNPPGKGTGWEPYPTSLRIVNWVKLAMGGRPLSAKALHSLAVQSRWLTRRLEYHLLGNHLFANAKALVFSGCLFDGPEAAGWLDKGMAILAQQLPEQILADGGQFELSPMYHALAYEDVLDLINVTRWLGKAMPTHWRKLVDDLPNHAAAMGAWLRSMCHPDGQIAFFNDAAIGIAPAPIELAAYAGRLGISDELLNPGTFVHHPTSGTARIESAGAVVLMDVGRVGPDYLPGHAHADTLSFEMSVGRRRVIVNSGTSVYGDGAERQRQRGTAAHNTVVVDGEDSSEVWAGFRVARRALPFDLSIAMDDGAVIICSHDGYRRLPGRPVHRRRWNMRGKRLTVTDVVEGRHLKAEARFHFHPEVQPSLDSTRSISLVGAFPGAEIRVTVAKGEARIERSTWHPEFGISQPSHVLVVALHEGQSEVTFRW